MYEDFGSACTFEGVDRGEETPLVWFHQALLAESQPGASDFRSLIPAMASLQQFSFLSLGYSLSPVWWDAGAGRFEDWAWGLLRRRKHLSVCAGILWYSDLFQSHLRKATLSIIFRGDSGSTHPIKTSTMFWFEVSSLAHQAFDEEAACGWPSAWGSHFSLCAVCSADENLVPICGPGRPCLPTLRKLVLSCPGGC